MSIFEKFFGVNPENEENNEAERERLKEQQRLISELGSFDLSSENIEKLSPDEINSLNKKIGELKQDLRAVSRPELEAQNHAVVPASEPIQSISTEDEVLKSVDNQEENLKKFFHQLFDDTLLGCLIAEKFREYDMEHWQETFKRELDKGAVTPFGDQSQILTDIYEKYGIDIKNPMPLDIEAFFERQKYNGGNIETELTRRREEKFKLKPQEEADIYELFWKLFRVPDEKYGTVTLADQELKKKLLDLKKKLPILN